jgi:hypothetical protein
LKRNRKVLLISICILILFIGGSLFAYHKLAPNANISPKTVTITINHLQGDNKTVKITSNSEFLGSALEKNGLIKLSKSQSGLLISTVDGESANESEKQWWGFTKAGAYIDTSIDKTPILDGDCFEFSLHAG